MREKKSAGAVIFIKNKEIKYLLLHYPSNSRTKKNYWGFSKGHIEKKEKEFDTVRREIKEETGLERIRRINGFKETIKYFFKDNGTIQKTVVFYLVQAKSKKIILSAEHIGYKWLNFQKAIRLLSFKNSKMILKKADKFIKENFFSGESL